MTMQGKIYFEHGETQTYDDVTILESGWVKVCYYDSTGSFREKYYPSHQIRRIE